MIETLKKYALAHLFYLVIIAIGLISARAWLQEHDQRVLSDAAVKTANAQVKDLQAQIVAVNAAAAQKVQVVTRIVQAAKTPQQAIAAIPQIAPNLNPEVVPLESTKVAVDALPLLQVIAQGKEDAINFQACRDTSALKDQKIAAKDDEIKTLTKKKSFFKRVFSSGKQIGIGIGIGLVLAAHGL